MQGRPDGLLAAGGVEQRRFQRPVLYHLQAVGGSREAIDANNADVGHPAQLPRYLVCGLAHGVVVGKNDVYIGVGAQHRRQARQHRSGLPVAF